MTKGTMLAMVTVIAASATLHSNVADARPRKKTKNPKPTATAPAPVEPTAPDIAPTNAPAASENAPASVGTTPTAPASPASGPASPPPAGPTSTEVRSDSAVASVDDLRQEYLALRDELFASRARAAAVSSQLFSTKVVIRFRFDAGRFYSVPKASIRLDGASVFEDTQGSIVADDAVRFTGFVAPGHHVVTFRVETIGKDDDRFSSANEAQVSVEAVAGKDLLVVARAKDAGDIPYAWKRSERGSYGLSMSVAVNTKKNDSAAVAAPATGKADRANK
ncbi:MAG: hypothetical protein KBG15_19995 [Kofleriaceae bacterium]|nr:hypothetical protein [Kofleriaceae bacterium]